MKTAGLDVHKDSIFCGVFNGNQYSDVEVFDTFGTGIRELGDYLKKAEVKRVAMESTSIYWVPVWNILCEMGFELMLVNPFLIKQLPGRKSDVKDAQWIAQLLYKDMLRGSFVPGERIQELRSYTRAYSKLQQRVARMLTKMDNILVQSGIRLGSLVTETGADMKVFENSGKLSGWIGLRPKNDESAGKYKSTAITKGNKYIKPILVQIAWAASRCKGSYFKDKFNRLSIRKPSKTALIAIARKISVVVWNVLKDLTPYNPTLQVVYEPAKLEAKIRYHQREMERIAKLKP